MTVDADPPAEPRRSLLRSPYAWAALAGIATLTILRALFPPPAPPPVLGRVGAFELVNTAGAPFGSADLAGRTWVASLFFTRCNSICPALMSAVAGLGKRLDAAHASSVLLVSITVDPEHDTPEILREYGAARSIDPARWSLLSGSPASVATFVAGGLRLGAGKPVEGPGGLMDIAHSGKLVVVDAGGCIRGYFDADTAGLDAAFRTAVLVRSAPCAEAP
jgi:protein SCO1/2